MPGPLHETNLMSRSKTIPAACPPADANPGKLGDMIKSPVNRRAERAMQAIRDGDAERLSQLFPLPNYMIRRKFRSHSRYYRDWLLTAAFGRGLDFVQTGDNKGVLGEVDALDKVPLAERLRVFDMLLKAGLQFDGQDPWHGSVKSSIVRRYLSTGDPAAEAYFRTLAKHHEIHEPFLLHAYDWHSVAGYQRLKAAMEAAGHPAPKLQDVLDRLVRYVSCDGSDKPGGRLDLIRQILTNFDVGYDRDTCAAMVQSQSLADGNGFEKSVAPILEARDGFKWTESAIGDPAFLLWARKADPEMKSDDVWLRARERCMTPARQWLYKNKPHLV